MPRSSSFLLDYKFMSYDWTTLSSVVDICKQIQSKKV